MKFKNEKLIRLLLIVLLLIVFIVQTAASRNFLNKKELLQSQIKNQRLQNEKLKRKYKNQLKLRPDLRNKAVTLKKNTAEIIEQSKKLNLVLVDLSSAQTELNLNLKGDFHSILKFIQYLELEQNQLEITEFKIKNNGNKLFFFLKLKNELIKNEKNSS
ncbi:hypothetical protein SAMN04488598_10188 [Halanaerobium congolense]|jgi:hypothetical protein|uniref:Uncharacterized protein n=1 Tax=Halanaerobium congolense TaxID=54121 RepID=A0A1G6HZR6_9FIRM|nr:hypothetical protein [Halanaerobium congolense]KXS50482.1 MAG: hypothetical protein AWL62_98 [Halanaerobium sp. T82-1]OEG62032.1 MAG: hypothetical protein BHK79_04570 [Halanaerobium sp. MDAL1]PUU91297.1 MAG: hypothetical protein CI948_1211 [Halanaerobium sp.]PTX17027.1 hypothetical protein C7953_1780 [Halanaerobium congolense]PXV65974.1 hypothetical protein C8C78_11224 [Halanaerobium congolense]